MNGSELIAAERQRQAEVEGWTAEHDDEHAEGSLIRAAVCYADDARPFMTRYGVARFAVWPWRSTDWKPSGDPVRSLVKAGALIAAEIDRIQRAAATTAVAPTRPLTLPDDCWLATDDGVSQISAATGEGFAWIVAEDTLCMQESTHEFVDRVCHFCGSDNAALSLERLDRECATCLGGQAELDCYDTSRHTFAVAVAAAQTCVGHSHGDDQPCFDCERDAEAEARVFCVSIVPGMVLPVVAAGTPMPSGSAYVMVDDVEPGIAWVFDGRRGIRTTDFPSGAAHGMVAARVRVTPNQMTSNTSPAT